MAVLALPAIEAVAIRVLAALGVGVIGDAIQDARDQAQKRRDEAERSETVPIIRTEALTKAREKCKDCPPDRGMPFVRNTNGWSELSVHYQLRVANMPAGPGFITEWSFNGVIFDGFDSAQCLLMEAKARYDQFFDEFGDPKDWWKGDEPIIMEATAQSAAATPQPPVHLRWHFMQPMSYRFFSRLFVSMTLPIKTVFQP